MARAAFRAAVAANLNWLKDFICEHSIADDGCANCLRMGRRTRSRHSAQKPVISTEGQWLEHFADEYGIPPSQRLTAYDALRGYFSAARRKPDR